MLKIGKIAYTNILPVYYFFHEKEMKDKVTFVHKVPAELNKDLFLGEIDLGPVSSFEYARHAEKYVVLADLSVSAHGAVGSIFLFTKIPLEQMKSPRIALTNTSATSINLLKVLLQKFYKLTPSYFSMAPHLQEMMEQADGALLIGDDALMAKRRNTDYFIYDLGELWYKQTGMWMTFALWTVCKQVALEHPELLAEIHQEFLRAKQEGLAHTDTIISSVQEQFGGEYSFWHTYFSGLCHDFGVEQKNGLEYFYRCAAELGLIEHPVDVVLWGVGMNAKLT